MSDRFDKTQQPAGDPDGRLGCKRRHNQGTTPKPPTPHANPVPADTLAVGEFYWGYASGIVAANETLGNVVLEAMASQLPVVTPRSGGVLDNVIDGQNGLLFEPEDRSALIACVRRLVEDQAPTHLLGVLARSYAATRTWPSVLDDLLDNYSALIEHYHAPATKQYHSRLNRKLRQLRASQA